jgi:hypothetical protein
MRLAPEEAPQLLKGCYFLEIFPLDSAKYKGQWLPSAGLVVTPRRLGLFGRVCLASLEYRKISQGTHGRLTKVSKASMRSLCSKEMVTSFTAKV